MLNNTFSKAEGTPESPAAQPSTVPAPINVWVVDDNQPLRSTLREILNQCDGLQCKATFHSPNALLSKLASKPGPDVILLDIQMGEACGLDAIRPIKALSRGTQVLMFTSCSDSESKKRAMSDGASDYLLKHFTLEQIQASIRRASKNPAPHLKCSQKTDRATGSGLAKSPSRPEASVLPRRKSVHWPIGSFLGRFFSLKHCLDVMHLRRN